NPFFFFFVDMLGLGVKVYIVYCYVIFWIHMSCRGENDEIRWQVIKAMLDEFPALREKVKVYIEKQQQKEKS
ncbi:MAG: hypothetical protein QXQ61_01480, partial [Candidatus Bathyarchaeia archaeon]